MTIPHQAANAVKHTPATMTLAMNAARPRGF